MNKSDSSMPQGPGAGTTARRNVQTYTRQPVPMGRRITVERTPGRGLAVTIERRSPRVFYLSDDEAAYLHGLLGRELPPVTVRRVGEQ